MKCLRCGYCCKRLLVTIVDDPEKGIVEDNLICYEGDGQCKHLLGDSPGNYSCALHDKSWYKYTPCFDYTQIEQSKDNECRVGRYIMDKQNNENNGRKRKTRRIWKSTT